MGNQSAFSTGVDIFWGIVVVPSVVFGNI